MENNKSKQQKIKDLLESRIELIDEFRSDVNVFSRTETRSALSQVEHMLKDLMSPEEFAKLEVIPWS